LTSTVWSNTFRLPQTAGKTRDFRRSFVPNIASAKKNMRKTRAATVRNRAQRSALRTALKHAKADDATNEQRAAAIAILDRAARKGLIHKASA
jgi:small subunit ribosomal protein S20